MNTRKASWPTEVRLAERVMGKADYRNRGKKRISMKWMNPAKVLRTLGVAEREDHQKTLQTITAKLPENLIRSGVRVEFGYAPHWWCWSANQDNSRLPGPLRMVIPLSH